MFEYCIDDFIKGFLAVFGIDDKPSFVRSKMSNKAEEINALLAGAEYLSEDYITKKLLTLLGDVDQIDDVMAEKDEENIDRFTEGGEDTLDTDEDTEEDTDDDVIGMLEDLLGEL